MFSLWLLDGSQHSVWQLLQWTHVKRHVSVPESQRSPVQIQELTQGKRLVWWTAEGTGQQTAGEPP